MKILLWRFFLAVFIITATDNIFAKGGKHAQQEQSENADDEDNTEEDNAEEESTDEAIEDPEESNNEEDSEQDEQNPKKKKKSSKSSNKQNKSKYEQKLIEKAKEEKRESQQHVRTLVDELLGGMHIGGGSKNRKAHTAGYIGERIDKLYKEIDSLQKSLQQFSKETYAEDSRAKTFQRDVHLALEKFLGHMFKDDGQTSSTPTTKKKSSVKVRRPYKGRLKCKGSKHTIFTVKKIKIPAGYRNSYLPYKTSKKSFRPKTKTATITTQVKTTQPKTAKNTVKYFNSKCATCGH